ncbi:MAG: hypothetical protein M3433_04445 [Actinomycetota bacterium]|nr:hypothetical protein [Actinomycetota bacterium]MDQ3647823.1 hypothetical protein [Actinomycetota bacterium]
MARLTLAVLAVLSLACASPAAAQPLQGYKTGGVIPPCKFNDRQLDKALGDLTPDVEQYAPRYAEQLQDARGAPCGGKGSAGSGGATIGADERVEDVPRPPSVGPSGVRGTTARGRAGVAKAPVPVPADRVRLADVSSPAITSRPTGPDLPAWALALIAAGVLAGFAIGTLFLFGADFSRFTGPLGASTGKARARAFDRAIELWETVRFGR